MAEQSETGPQPAGLHGIIPYIVTPVDETGPGLRIRRDALSALCDHLIRAGVHGLSPLGSTGEFPYLPDDAQVEVVRTAVAAAAGRVPVVPGVGAFATASAVSRAQAFEDAGADALVVILQEYFPLTTPQIVGYFRAVADAVSIPVCVYTNPSFIGKALPVDAIRQLSEHPRINYMKDASPNTGRILSIMNVCEGRLKIFSASSHIPLLVLALGGVGWMAGPAAAAPRECLELYRLAAAGEWGEAMALQRRLWRLNEAFAAYSPAASMKAALSILGHDVGAPVKPQDPLPEDAERHLRQVLQEVAGRGIG